MAIHIKDVQLKRLSDGWIGGTTAFIVGSLNKRWANATGPKAERFHAAGPAAVQRYVRHIVTIASPHGFTALDDLQALVDACIEHDARRFLAQPILENPAFSPREKIAIMQELLVSCPYLDPPVRPHS